MNTKRILALVLSLCMIFSLAISGVAFADDDANVVMTVTINPNNGVDEPYTVELDADGYVGGPEYIPETPSKDASDGYRYEFKCWRCNGVEVTFPTKALADAEIVADYEQYLADGYEFVVDSDEGVNYLADNSTPISQMKANFNNIKLATPVLQSTTDVNDPAVAEANNTSYTTLEDAITNAPSGGTVKLLADIDYSTTYTERNARDYDREHVIDLKNLTLNLNNHTISTINATVVFAGNGATITNGTFALVPKNTDGSYKDGSYALIIDNSVVPNYGNTAKVTVTNVVCDGAVNVKGATVELNNVTAHTTPTKFYAVWAEGDANVTINSGTYTDNQNNGKGVLATGTGDEGGAVLNVKGGTFNAANQVVYSAEEDSIKISGGTFSKEVPEKYCAEGFIPTANTDGTYGVKVDTAVAKIGSTKYDTLQEAIDAATEGATIELVKDITLSTVLTMDGNNKYGAVINKSITIDGADHIITSQTNRAIGIMGASSAAKIDVTIKNLTINNAINGGGCIFTRGNLNSLSLQNVKLYMTGTGYTQPLTISGNTQTNTANVTITNCEFQSHPNCKNGYAIINWVPANFIITSSTIKGWACLYAKPGSAGTTFTVTESSLISKNLNAGNTNSFGVIVFEDNNVTATVTDTLIDVSGQNNTQAIAVFNTEYATNSDNVLSGCKVILGDGNTITMKDDARIASNAANDNISGGGTVSISGGTFDKPIAEQYCAEGMIPATLDETGKYSVKTGTYVAAVLEPVEGQEGSYYYMSGYETLEEAFAAAVDGDTIKLLANCSGNGIIVPQGKFNTNGLTVDFGGYTYTVSGETLAGSTGTKTQAFQLLKNNTITFTNGAIVGDNNNVKMLIQNYSNLTLDNMTLNANEGNNSVGYVLSTNNGKTVIKDTKITAKDGGVAFDVDSGWGNYASNSVEVTGESVITGDIEVAFEGKTAGTPSVLTLTSGTLTGNIKTGNGFVKTTVTKASSFNQAAPEGYEWSEVVNGVQTLVHVHSWGAPEIVWEEVAGGWTVKSCTHTCSVCDETVDVEYTLDSRIFKGVVTYTATAGEYTETKTQTMKYVVDFGGTKEYYKWGEVVSLNANQFSTWRINGVVVADGLQVYTFAVTENSTVTAEQSTNTVPQAVITSSLTSEETGRAVFNAKWSLPNGAKVESVKIFRGFTSADKNITVERLQSVGTKIVSNLRATNGDYTLRLYDLTSGKYQHVVLVLKYTIGGETITITTADNHADVADRVLVK